MLGTRADQLRLRWMRARAEDVCVAEVLLRRERRPGVCEEEDSPCSAGLTRLDLRIVAQFKQILLPFWTAEGDRLLGVADLVLFVDECGDF